ncbi:elongation factor P [Candidatus Gottesmanbacteria bacterium]|nr:elongation factor P [Candidatus Gottesmanbacteria bacterium]
MGKISTADFQKGMFIEYKDEPHQIVDLTFVNPGKGSAFVRTKLKSVKTGRVQEFTYKSGESAQELPVEVHEMQYLYKESDKYIFMNNRNYEQTSLSEGIIGNFSKFLKEGDTQQILIYEGKAIGMRFPKKVRLLVTEAEEGAKGNTVMGAKKMVRVETGVELAVPLFIKKGDVVAIDPETGEYLQRESMP